MSLVLFSATGYEAYAQNDEDQRFENVEIRVVRPRFFNKRKRFELGAQFSAVMNETFIYTFMASGLANYHLNESWSLGVNGSFGLSMDKSDKRILFDNFEIKTKILRTLYSVDAEIQFTPIYGKWQMTGGKLVYFDTFLIGGAGMTGIQYRYSDFCTAPEAAQIARADGPSALPPDKVVPYPSVVFGLGQRFFVSNNLAYNVSVKDNIVFPQVKDGSCDTYHPDTGTSDANYNIMLQIGASKYF